MSEVISTLRKKLLEARQMVLRKHNALRHSNAKMQAARDEGNAKLLAAREESNAKLLAAREEITKLRRKITLYERPMVWGDGDAIAHNTVEGMPADYRSWISLLRCRGFTFELHREMLKKKENRFRTFLRHDIDLFDRNLMERCLEVEAREGVRSTWYFLPPNDFRYKNQKDELRKVILAVKAAGHEVGYHINVWEKPGTKELSDDPLGQLDHDLQWFHEVLGEPIKTAVAHGIPHMAEIATNLSMFEPLNARGVLHLDPFIIPDGGEKPVPYIAHCATNPTMRSLPLICYISDSGGPIRRVWGKLEEVLDRDAVIILNTHCANYDITRTFTYAVKRLSGDSIPKNLDIEILI